MKGHPLGGAWEFLGPPMPLLQAHLAESAWTVGSREPLVLLVGLCVHTASSFGQGSPKPFLLQPSSWAPKASAACACSLGFVLLGWVLGCLPGHLCLPNVLLVKALVKDIHNCGGKFTKNQTQPTDVECESKMLLLRRLNMEPSLLDCYANSTWLIGFLSCLQSVHV